jgi:undecaprenyl-diphosphatase
MLDKLQKFIHARRWPFWLAVLLILGGVWGFAAVAEEVQEGDTQRFDEQLFLAIADQDAHKTVKEIGRDLTGLGGFAIITLIVLFVVVTLAIQRKYAAIALILVSTLGALAVSTALKAGFDRPRPELVEQSSYVATSSFPSGHSMLAASVYLSLGLLGTRFTRNLKLKVFFMLFAILLTVCVGVSRIFVGVHWPTDVAAGWAGGAVWALLCYLVARELQQRQMVEKPEQTIDDIDPLTLQPRQPEPARI